MIITKIRLQEEHPMTKGLATWPLPTCDLDLTSLAGENGYILKDSQGLDPPDLVAVVEGFDPSGIPVMNSSPDKRDVVLVIGLNPGLGQTYSSLRDNLYKLIDRTIFVKLMNDSIIIAQTTGHIRTFDTVLFSNSPQVELTIECPDGDFAAPQPTFIPIVDVNTLTPVINYEDGTAPAGMELKFTVTANHTGFNIFNYSKFWYLGSTEVANSFAVTYAFLIGDVVTITTETKKRRVTLLRSGITYDIAGYINSGAVWPKLYSGVNSFEWTFASSWMTWISASYIPKYWGV